MVKMIVKQLAVLLLGLHLAGCASTDGGRSTGEVIDDTAIQAKVKAALINDPVVKGMEIDVGVNRGEVQLSGVVSTPDERRKAETIAEGVGGVRRVHNNIRLNK